MPEEGEAAITFDTGVASAPTNHPQESAEAIIGNEITGKVAEFSKNIDELRFGITKKDGHENNLNDADSYVREHIDDMLQLCLTREESSVQALRNVYLTLLCAHLTDDESLRSHVEEYFLEDKKRLEQLVTNTASDNSLPVFASLYHGAGDERKDQLEEVLSGYMDVFDPLLEKGDLRFVLTFLDTLASRKTSPYAEQFRKYLEDKMNVITRHLSVDDISKSEQIFSIAQKLYSSEEGVGQKYLDLLGLNLEVLLKGFREGKFSSELISILQGKADSNLKGKVVESLVSEFKTGEDIMKREIYEMLSMSLVADQTQEVSDSIIDFLNDNSDFITEDIFHSSGKIYYLDVLLRFCSDEVVEKIFQEIDGKLDVSEDAGANAYLFNILNGSIGQRSGSIRRAMPLYEKHMQKIQNVIYDPFLLEQLKGWKADVYKTAVSKAALYGSDEVIGQAVEMICHSLQFDPGQFFRQYGLEAEKFIDAWRQGLGDVFENFSYNKIAIDRLVAERGSDIIKTLSEEFGIRNFSRYPTNLLVKQYDEREVKDKKFGVLLFSTFDHGKAFNSEEDRLVMDSMKEQLGPDICMRFAEAGTRFELVKRLSQIYQRYGQMSFGLVGAHGADHMFQLGFGGERKELSVNDLIGAGAEKVGKFFEDGATLILESCSTGADSGLAEQLSRSLGIKVIAPKEDSGGIHKIKVATHNNTPPDFDINFFYTKGREYQMGSLMHESKAIEDDESEQH